MPINLAALTKPFPKSEIRQRKGRRGKMLDYVETHAVIARLNEAFDGEWSFRVISHWREDEEAIVLAMLSAGGQVKQQFGSSAITREREGGRPLSIGDDLKAAASDALKKCASTFGVALELYGRTPEQGRGGNGRTTPKATPPASGPGHTPRDRLQKARDEILKLPNGFRIFQGLLKDNGAERIEDLSEDRLAKVLNHCELLYRTARNGRGESPRDTGLKGQA